MYGSSSIGFNDEEFNVNEEESIQKILPSRVNIAKEF
jgi:hypothetical protein